MPSTEVSLRNIKDVFAIIVAVWNVVRRQHCEMTLDSITGGLRRTVPVRVYEWK